MKTRQEAIQFIKGNAVMGYDYHVNTAFYESQSDEALIKWANEQDEHEADYYNGRSYASILR